MVNRNANWFRKAEAYLHHSRNVTQLVCDYDCRPRTIESLPLPRAGSIQRALDGCG
jgi:hypothetical protein